MLLSFVSTRDPFGCLVINLEGTVQVTESNIGLIIEPIPELLSSGSSRSMWCGEHFKTIDHSAYISRGTPLVRWDDTSPVRQVSIKPP